MTSNHLTQPITDGKTDPVAEWGREIDRVSKEIIRLDERHAAMNRAHQWAEANVALSEFEQASDRRHAIELMVSTTPATSIQGAMAQVMVAHSFNETASSHVEPDPEYFRWVGACLISALAALERHCGTECAGIEYYTTKQGLAAARAAIEVAQ